MQNAQTSLLFLGNTTLAMTGFSQTLNRRVAPLGLNFTHTPSDTGQGHVYFDEDIRLTVTPRGAPLPATAFVGALENALSAPHRGHLSEVLFRHSRHIDVEVSLAEAPDTTQAVLRLLSLLHAVTVLLSEWHMPAAVFWRQSNQLLTGTQYLGLARVQTPWVLFAAARTTQTLDDMGLGILTRIDLDPAGTFAGAPVRLQDTDRAADEMHAAAIAFLRHAYQTGAPVPDGQSFAAEGMAPIRVVHIAPSQTLPRGRFDLYVDLANAPARLRGAAPVPDRRRIMGAGLPDDRARSLAISYMMLAVMPPIGMVLLVLNAILGPNVWRTGTIAAASTALALFVGAWTFLSYVGQQTSVLLPPASASSAALVDNVEMIRIE